jgi:hypothetical protein
MDTDKKWDGRAGSPLPAARGNANHGAHGVTRPTFKSLRAFTSLCLCVKFHSTKSNPTSTARAECVSAPTEM